MSHAKRTYAWYSGIAVCLAEMEAKAYLEIHFYFANLIGKMKIVNGDDFHFFQWYKKPGITLQS